MILNFWSSCLYLAGIPGSTWDWTQCFMGAGQAFCQLNYGSNPFQIIFYTCLKAWHINKHYLVEYFSYHVHLKVFKHILSWVLISMPSDALLVLQGFSAQYPTVFDMLCSMSAATTQMTQTSKATLPATCFQVPYQFFEYMFWKICLPVPDFK